MIEEPNTSTENVEPASLWKDRVKNANVKGAGRQRNKTWDSSVLKYIKSYTTRMGWSTTAVCKEVVNALRLLADRYEPVARVIEVWDSYPDKARTRVFSLDRACDEAEIDRDEFAGLVLAAVSKHIQRNSISIIDQSFERIIQAAVDHAITGGPAGSKERIELIRLLTRPDRDGKKVEPVKTGKVASEIPAPETSQAKSLDDQLAEFDTIETLGVGE